MAQIFDSQIPDRDPQETHEWHEAIADVVRLDGSARAHQLMASTLHHASRCGAELPALLQTPYVNSIPPTQQPEYPGDLKLERRIRAINRWNAVAMVARANKTYSGIGGHMSSYASSANLYELGFNHFFRGPGESGHGADLIFYQGHATPGMYARAFLEGRLTTAQLDHFRRETHGGGLPSYPHPWLLPQFWQFPTVSMGLGPINAIYQARYNRYLHNRGLKDTAQQRVWAFLGDGECDEPETLGALSLAAREGLDNLVFVINCNLQRLDGPVRGNGKIIQELESVFRGAGWDVIKVIWGEEWDPLIAADSDGLLVERLNATVDGQFQKWTVAGGGKMREELFGGEPGLEKMVAHLTDAQIGEMRRGGHSDVKLHAAYKAATQAKGPVCILAHTIKGWTLGDKFEASNVTHQMKKMATDQLTALRDRLQLPIADKDVEQAGYYHPGKNSDEVQYTMARRATLGGSLPVRKPSKVSLKTPADGCFTEFFTGSKAGVEASTTMGFVRLLRNLMRDKAIGKHVVPIIPDEARTFGMDPFFREFGIYAAHGQKYVPVDADLFLNYHEAQNGQLLEEGITEAGSMASFMAASTAHATHGLMTIPFYVFYSMFGLQRTGDQVWSVGDARGRGFMLGATAGRTTLHGEGLQHNDGHSQLFAQATPNLLAYDPAFAFETAVIIRDGLRRMLVDNEDVFYYITLYNENCVMPAMPKGKGIEDGIVRGLYRFKPATKGRIKVQVMASGPMVNIALEAQAILADTYDVGADILSATSYQQLFRDGRAVERYNRLHPEAKPKVPYVAQVIEQGEGPVVAVSDWVQEVPSLIHRFVPRRFAPLGTNGFGRSDTREALRAHFEVDAAAIVVTVLHTLMLEGAMPAKTVQAALKKFGIDPERQDPMLA
jgi:pyruvate dehydrogenase E1 component